MIRCRRLISVSITEIKMSKLHSILLSGILILLTVFGFNPIMATQVASATSNTQTERIENIDRIKENYLVNHSAATGKEKGRIMALQGKQLGQVFRKQGQSIGQYHKNAGRGEQNKIQESLTLEQIYQNWGKGLYW